MTYAAKEEAWIDGIIQASRPAGYAESAAHHAAPSFSGLDGNGLHDPRHAALLSRLLAQSAAQTPPCVLFVACDGSSTSSAIAMGTAQAAAGLLGRALVLDAWLGRRRSTASAEDQTYGTPIPDAFTPRLYHRQLARSGADIALLFGSARAGALAALVSPFRYVAIDAPPPAAGPAASALAPLCLGTVLVVTAAQCGLGAIRHAASQINAAGGHIIGSVLADAPCGLPSWTRAT